MSYSELIKHFERVREYMREFYIYGFKSREEYDRKCGRSYDNERRRMECWLEGHMEFRHTSEGKNVFLSIDSRNTGHNPLFKAWKAKSFTDRDITLHFILMDILHSPEIALTVPEIVEKVDGEYFSFFDEPMAYDESTLRKKLKEYTDLGIVTKEKRGRQAVYRNSGKADLSEYLDALEFYSEVLPCGVVGSCLLDRPECRGLRRDPLFSYKHHYITHALDSEITEKLAEAVTERKSVTISNLSPKSCISLKRTVVPLKFRISVQNGRQYLMSYDPENKAIRPWRLDYITDVSIGERVENFDDLRRRLTEMEKYMWGVSCRNDGTVEHVEFTVTLGPHEEYIYQRLEREKRCGKVERLSPDRCRFSADVYDSAEIIPWIRTFICRIDSIDFSNRTVQDRFLADLEDMYRLYEAETEAETESEKTENDMDNLSDEAAADGKEDAANDFS